MKHLQHTYKTSETFELYTCNLHRIPVRPPPPSASERRRAAAVARGEARELPRLGLTPLLALTAPVGVVGQGGRQRRSSARNMSKSATEVAGPAREAGAAGRAGGTGAGGAGCRSEVGAGAETAMVRGWETPRDVADVNMKNIALLLFFFDKPCMAWRGSRRASAAEHYP
jgi:hypothetical protein